MRMSELILSSENRHRRSWKERERNWRHPEPREFHRTVLYLETVAKTFRKCFHFHSISSFKSRDHPDMRKKCINRSENRKMRLRGRTAHFKLVCRWNTRKKHQYNLHTMSVVPDTCLSGRVFPVYDVYNGYVVSPFWYSKTILTQEAVNRCQRHMVSIHKTQKNVENVTNWNPYECRSLHASRGIVLILEQRVASQELNAGAKR